MTIGVVYAGALVLFLRVYRQQPGPVRRSLLVLLVFVALDGLVMGQGIWTLLVATVAVVAQLRLSAWRAVKRDAPRSRAHLRAAGVYVITVAMVLAYVSTNNRIAARRADEVIAACRGYEAAHGRLPTALSELVPAFLPRVPRAKYTLMYADFAYWTAAAGDGAPDGVTAHHSLMYVVMPPFGRRLYQFETNSWRTVD